VPMTAVTETNGMDANVSCSAVSANDRFQASRWNTQAPAVDPKAESQINGFAARKRTFSL
jgi:hypothetical protein